MNAPIITAKMRNDAAALNQHFKLSNKEIDRKFGNRTLPDRNCHNHNLRITKEASAR